MFIDHAIIHCQAGQGGNGCNSSIHSAGSRHNRPTGGDGGQGGSVILMTSPHVRTLLDLQMRKNFEAENGKHGGSNHKNGATGRDQRILIPLGTEVYNDETGYLLKDMCTPHEELVVCRGGQGGKGNHRKSESLPGALGEVKNIRLELKLIADVGLVGFPNAGKSTLISHLSNAKSRIAAFPFTTKEPVLGVVQSAYGDSFVVADIPGLIEGAHEGRGLGHEFLRHIERTKMFVHLVDMSAIDGRDPVEDYYVINKELANYSPAFAKKKKIVVANKMDVPEARGHLVEFKQAVEENVLELSAATGIGLPELIQHLFQSLNAEAA